MDCVRLEEELRSVCVVEDEISFDAYCFGRKDGESMSVVEGDWGERFCCWP